MLRSRLPAPTTSNNIRHGTGFAVCNSCLRVRHPLAEWGISPYLARHTEPQTWAVGRTQGAISRWKSLSKPRLN
jgi:hypothetical protein